MTPNLSLKDPAFVSVAGGGGGDDWEETFPFSSTVGWTINSGAGGTITPASNVMDYDNVDQPCFSYAAKPFANGALSDTMWTMLADKVIWTKVDSVAAPCYFGASDRDSGMKDSNTISWIGGLMAGCGPTNYGTHGASKYLATAIDYLACWLGNGTGSDNWCTNYRTSATGIRFILYPTASKTSSDYDETGTIDSGITGLDRVICNGQDDGPYGRDSDGTIDTITFKNEVNEE